MLLELNESYKFIQTELAETTAKATKFKEAIKKMTRKADKDQATQVVLNMVKEAEELKKQIEVMKTMAKNHFQPPPELVEVDAMIN